MWIVGQEKSARCPGYPKNTVGSVFGAHKQATITAATPLSKP